VNCSFSIDSLKAQPFHPIEAEPLASFLGRVVSWIKKDRPLILTIAVQCLTAIAALFLCLSLVGLPVVYYAMKESNRQDYVARENAAVAKEEIAAAARLEEIKKIVVVDVYNALPNLDLQGRRGKTGYIDFLEKGDLSASAMKGVDYLNRFFITFKVRNKSTGTEFTQTAFQRYPKDSYWVWGGNEVPGDGIFENRGIDQKGFERLAKLLNGKDAEFELIT
jgi:hypothetical protein